MNGNLMAAWVEKMLRYGDHGEVNAAFTAAAGNRFVFAVQTAGDPDHENELDFIGSNTATIAHAACACWDTLQDREIPITTTITSIAQPDDALHCGICGELRSRCKGH